MIKSGGGNSTDIEELSGLHKAILVNFCKATKGSKGAHLPKPYFMSKPPIQGHKADRALRELLRWGYMKSHPTRNETTYELDDRGFEVCMKLRDMRKKL